MIRPITIRLIDRDEDLNFYKKVKPIKVEIVDFNRNQNRTIVNTIVFTQEINEDAIVIEQS